MHKHQISTKFKVAVYLRHRHYHSGSATGFSGNCLIRNFLVQDFFVVPDREVPLQSVILVPNLKIIVSRKKMPGD